ncbi:O-antigen ligase domain-containing protein [Kribbella antibiotica]|uniref:O-antigen ligase domain-containing protein n=1 Tax=Kribbella antibiotica TaxID=190195 RepID=A0A4R4ZPC0_9ACTN|nr:O-antigen ligase domain-containing protein [Kribbella antibiotica]TDD60758.1 O-antigen ligase domain-containing protein [Kribbella antibiotica]
MSPIAALSARLVPKPGFRPVPPERRRRRRVQLVWALLVMNVLTFFPDSRLLIPIPSALGRLIAQGSLPLALLLVLTVNRPLRVRPSVYMFLGSLLVTEAVISSLRAEFLVGALYRSTRLTLFVLVLWLLSPWWTRRDLLLVRTHLMMLWAIIGTVLAGVLISPGGAMVDDRLSGVLWPIPATQVGHYAAMATGLTAVLWMAGLLRREVAVLAVLVTVPILLLTHTRTALIALLVGGVIAGLSLFTARARARRLFAIAIGVFSAGALTIGSVVTTWLARGQDTEELGALTGRKVVWDGILAQPRSTFETLFGFGLSNKSFTGLPIDSNWFGTYFDVGVLGVAFCIAMVLFVFVGAWFTPQGPRRAIALFIVAYCVVASFTETGLSEASPYLLELTLAASLVYPRPSREGGA